MDVSERDPAALVVALGMGGRTRMDLCGLACICGACSNGCVSLRAP